MATFFGRRVTFEHVSKLCMTHMSVPLYSVLRQFKSEVFVYLGQYAVY